MDVTEERIREIIREEMATAMARLVTAASERILSTNATSSVDVEPLSSIHEAVERHPTVELSKFQGDDGGHVLSIPEAACKLGVSRGTAYAAARSGDLPGILPRMGKRLLVSRCLLEKYLKGERNCSLAQE